MLSYKRRNTGEYKSAILSINQYKYSDLHGLAAGTVIVINRANYSHRHFVLDGRGVGEGKNA